MTAKFNNLFASEPMLSDAGAAGVVSDTFIVESPNRAFLAFVTGAAAKAQVRIEVSLDGKHFLTLATITLDAAAGLAVEGFSSQAPWRFVRAAVESVSSGTVSVWAGV